MVFDKNQLDLVEEIYNVGIKNDIKYINIENWPILIYFYFEIKKINLEYYSFPKYNMFITLIEKGNKSSIKLA